MEAAKGAETVPDTTVDLLRLKGMQIAPCIGCNACVKKGRIGCVLYQDDMQRWNKEFFEYDGILIASPIYDMGITPQLSAFFSRFRSEYLNQKKNPMIRMFQPGAAMAVGGTRNGGQESVIQIIHGFYHTMGMPIVNGGLGIYGGVSIWSKDRLAAGVADDEQGLSNARFLGMKLALTAAAMQIARTARGSNNDTL
jgi:multimeric flavodoxin WrbA